MSATPDNTLADREQLIADLCLPSKCKCTAAVGFSSPLERAEARIRETTATDGNFSVVVQIFARV
jgi:hypothetical protein